MNHSIRECARDTPVTGSSDVLIAGAGPAGVVAALAAARSGASVRLIDVAGCLGGVWTAGLLCWIIDAQGKGGIVAELGDRLDARGARSFRKPGGRSYAYDPETMKLLLEELCSAAGVQVQLHTRVVAAAVDEQRRLRHVITESVSGRQAWAARVFIDCSGNGDLAQRAGCGFDLGRAEDGGVQPMSFPALVAGIRFADVEPFVGGNGPESKRRFGDLCRSLGVAPSYPDPMLCRIHDDLFGLICDHQFGVPAEDAAAVSAASMGGRREVHALVDALRASGGAWRDLRVVATSEHIGVRESRRIHGRAAITIDELCAGTHPADSIATCRFGLDVHCVRPDPVKVADHPSLRTQPFGLPLRALIARDVDGLLMAGRCISGDFLAHSSYRVTGDAAAMGQAAGLCAALAAGDAASPHEVPACDVLAGLRASGAALPAPAGA